MTKHRIESNKVVVEDDLRANFRPWGKHDDREFSHNYSQPHKIIYVPVKLREGIDGVKIVGDEYHCFTGDRKVAYADIPFHPDDTLILMEEWVVEDGGVCLLSSLVGLPQAEIDCLRKLEEIEPASTMPSELDSECQQYKLVKTLGVEERRVWKYQHPSVQVDRWHWKLLTEVANDHTQN